MTKIKLENIKKSLKNDKDETLVLSNINFHINENEFCCVLGPSGCGKTTLLNLISGISTPDNGKISFTESKNNLLPTISYVFQQHRLLLWKTVRDNLKFAIIAAGLEKKENINERISNYLEIVGLSGKENKFPSFLSEGERFRVSIARALCIEPDLILMDEPFSHLDELTARLLRKELLNIWEKKKHTIIFVTHNPREAAYLADKIIVLSSLPGKVMGEIKVRQKHPRKYGSKEQMIIERKILYLLKKFNNKILPSHNFT